MVREVGQCVCPMSLWNKLIWTVYGFKNQAVLARQFLMCNWEMVRLGKEP